MSVVDDYLVGLGKPQMAELERIRKMINKIAPDSVEATTYGVPGFKYKGKFFIGFAANSNFLSLYPASTAIDIYKDELGSFDLSKGAIRFTVDHPIPGDLLEKTITFRYKQVSDKY